MKPLREESKDWSQAEVAGRVGILLVADGHQLARDDVAVPVKLVGNLIADAVEHHARMVAVAAQHGPQVGLAPLVEVEMITVLRFAGRVFAVVVVPVPRPFVKGLIEDVKTQLIAQVVELRRERVMAGADGVATHLLEPRQAQGPDRRRDGVAERAGVLVDADALELGRAAVDQQAAVGIEPNWRMPKVWRFRPAATPFTECAAQLIQFRGAVGPEAGVGHRDPLGGALAGEHVGQGQVGGDRGDFRAVRAQHTGAQDHLAGRRPWRAKLSLSQARRSDR